VNGTFYNEAFPVTRGVQPSAMGMTTVGFKPGDYKISVVVTPQDSAQADHCDGSASLIVKRQPGDLQKIALESALTAGSPARLVVSKTYPACSFHLVLKNKTTNKEATHPENMEMADSIVQQHFGATDPFTAGEYTATIEALEADKTKGDACIGSATMAFTVSPAPKGPPPQLTASKVIALPPSAATYAGTNMDVFYNPNTAYKAGQPVLLKLSVVGGQGVKGCYGAVRNAPMGSGIDVDIPHYFQISTAYNDGLKKAVGNASIDLSQDAFGSASKPGTYGWTLVRNVTSPFPDYPPCQFDTTKPLITNGTYTVAP
jgi:hypothetical protein